MRQYFHIILTVLLISFFSGCLKTVTATTAEKHIALRNAINTNNFALLADAIELPFVISEQEWITAGDGYGYVLGGKSTLVANTPKDLNDALKILERVEIEGEAPLDQQFVMADFKDELTGISHHWESLDLVVFFRGQGDVEHILVLGLDKKSEKLRAIYVN